ncbi:hypothetical protein CSB88_2407 [Pseudomonas aeruginosa]|nr:hypothetical protein CSB88_2407 [Pseudomonas aeruginosa]
MGGLLHDAGLDPRLFEAPQHQGMHGRRTALRADDQGLIGQVGDGQLNPPRC